MIVKEVLGDKFFQNGKEYQSGRSKVKLTAMDNKAGVKEILYSINGGEYQSYSEPFYLPKTNGAISIAAYAIDNVNNSGKNNNNNKKFLQPSYVDLSGPSLKHSFQGTTYQSYGKTYISDKTQIKLSGYDNETGIKELQYSVNEQNTKIYSDKISFSTEGKQKVKYIGYDNVSNSSQKEFEVIVDIQGPTIQKVFSIDTPNQVYPKQTQIYLSATDKQVGTKTIYYSINGGPEKVYAAPIKGFQEGKNYQIKVRAIDQLQNEKTLDFQFQTKGNEL